MPTSFMYGPKERLSMSEHSALMSNQTKVWKTKTGPLQDDKAWSAYPNSAFFEILHSKEHFYYF